MLLISVLLRTYQLLHVHSVIVFLARWRELVVKVLFLSEFLVSRLHVGQTFARPGCEVVRTLNCSGRYPFVVIESAETSIFMLSVENSNLCVRLNQTGIDLRTLLLLLAMVVLHQKRGLSKWLLFCYYYSMIKKSKLN